VVRILRARPAGTDYGGTGQIKAAPGAQANIRSGDNNIEQAAALLRIRTRARAAYARLPIGSRGRL
jgi:hypothetical protein